MSPSRDEIFEREPYELLTDVIEDIDIVEIFRSSDEITGIIDDALNRDDVTVIRMQVGIRDDAATRVPRLPAAVSFRIGVRKSKTEC